MSTVIVGLGNPVLTDDAVGLTVAAELRRRLAGRAGIEVVELCAGGLRLMEALAGHERAILIDAIESGRPAGTIVRLGMADLPLTRSASSSHDGSLAAAWELARAIGLRIPSEVSIWAVEAADVQTFGERLTGAVEPAARRVVEEILCELGHGDPPAQGELDEDRRISV